MNFEVEESQIPDGIHLVDRYPGVLEVQHLPSKQSTTLDFIRDIVTERVQDNSSVAVINRMQEDKPLDELNAHLFSCKFMDFHSHPNLHIVPIADHDENVERIKGVFDQEGAPDVCVVLLHNKQEPHREEVVKDLADHYGAKESGKGTLFILTRPEGMLDNPAPEHPLDLVTKKFRPRKILYHHDEFVIAQGDWEGKLLDAIACRYHPSGSAGYPQMKGMPQWMHLPVDPKRVRQGDNPLFPDEISLTFRRDVSNLAPGMFIKTKRDWHLVTYIYGEGDEMVSAIGLGKPDSYPLPINTITGVRHEKSLLSHWHHKTVDHLWIDHRGGIWLSSYDDRHNEGHDNVFMLIQLVHVGQEKQIVPSTGLHDEVDKRPNWKIGEARDLGYLYQLNEMGLLATLPRHKRNLNSVYEWLDTRDWKNAQVDEEVLFSEDFPFLDVAEYYSSKGPDVFFFSEKYYRLVLPE